MLLKVGTRIWVEKGIIVCCAKCVIFPDGPCNYRIRNLQVDSKDIIMREDVEPQELW